MFSSIANSLSYVGKSVQTWWAPPPPPPLDPLIAKTIEAMSNDKGDRWSCETLGLGYMGKCLLKELGSLKTPQDKEQFNRIILGTVVIVLAYQEYQDENPAGSKLYPLHYNDLRALCNFNYVRNKNESFSELLMSLIPIIGENVIAKKLPFEGISPYMFPHLSQMEELKELQQYISSESAVKRLTVDNKEEKQSAGQGFKK